ncbi:MAG TPA: methionine--tRNA ligase [Phycisphaerales bacterium]|nr:methionine--tRNA ligase [Phycisphaerales bacterium]
MHIMNKYYITTPIYYANDNPHIGHIATTVFSDIIARYHKLQGEDILFLTGLDEHGEKVALAAQKAKKDPQQFVDELAKKWQSYWEKLNIKYDIFMRTTNPEHAKIVGELLTQLKENGDIYRATYKGVYCIGCEEFKADRDLVNGLCPEHHPDQVCQKEEENYFFKLSKYIPEIKKGIADGIIPLEPESKRKEILARLEEEVRDLSISRQNVPWGIKLPWDEIQTVYVWVEALINYFSATKIYKKEEFWPADLHFLGKGNNWFHSVIWPAILMSAGYKLPNKLLVHGYLNLAGQKMSKSLGNVISPDEVVKKYGADVTRMYEMFMGPLEATKPWNMQGVEGVHRFLCKFWRTVIDETGNIKSTISDIEADEETQRLLHQTIKKVGGDIDNFRFNTAISQMMIFVNHIGKLPALPRKAIEAFVLLLAPFSPHIAEEVWQKLSHKKTLAYENWPKYSEELAAEKEIEIAVQVLGRIKDKIVVPADADDEFIKQKALACEKVISAITGKEIKKVIVIKSRLVNIVI